MVMFEWWMMKNGSIDIGWMQVIDLQADGIVIEG